MELYLIRHADAQPLGEGGVEDDADDYDLKVWAGVIPLQLVPGAAIRDERCDAATPTPAYAANYRR